jgi:hypothetical protein
MNDDNAILKYQCEQIIVLNETLKCDSLIHLLNKYNDLIINKSKYTIGYFDEYCHCGIPDIRIFKTLYDIVSNNVILEVFSGHSFWSYLMSVYGFNIITTDLNDQGVYKKNELINCIDAIKEHNVNYLMMISPPNDVLVYECLKYYKGQYLIYIGESIKFDNWNIIFKYEIMNFKYFNNSIYFLYNLF